MALKARPYGGEEDYWRMREFLRRVFVANGRREVAWHVSRLDYARWHTCANCARVALEDVATLWEASEGDLAAFMMPFDDPTRSAYFEPVATIPSHQKRGLGKALLTEGLRRLQRMGATRAFVGGYSDAANALYRSVMGGEHELSEPWVKEWNS